MQGCACALRSPEPHGSGRDCWGQACGWTRASSLHAVLRVTGPWRDQRDGRPGALHPLPGPGAQERSACSVDALGFETLPGCSVRVTPVTRSHSPGLSSRRETGKAAAAPRRGQRAKEAGPAEHQSPDSRGQRDHTVLCVPDFLQALCRKAGAPLLPQPSGYPGRSQLAHRSRGAFPACGDDTVLIDSHTLTRGHVKVPEMLHHRSDHLQLAAAPHPLV